MHAFTFPSFMVSKFCHFPSPYISHTEPLLIITQDLEHALSESEDAGTRKHDDFFPNYHFILLSIMASTDCKNFCLAQLSMYYGPLYSPSSSHVSSFEALIICCHSCFLYCFSHNPLYKSR